LRRKRAACVESAAGDGLVDGDDDLELFVLLMFRQMRFLPPLRKSKIEAVTERAFIRRVQQRVGAS
jgi:hypothetical protein